SATRVTRPADRYPALELSLWPSPSLRYSVVLQIAEIGRNSEQRRVGDVLLCGQLAQFKSGGMAHPLLNLDGGLPCLQGIPTDTPSRRLRLAHEVHQFRGLDCPDLDMVDLQHGCSPFQDSWYSLSAESQRARDTTFRLPLCLCYSVRSPS